ncbi:redox-active disulfide protein 2 [Candidatus Vecturithrix granuli]|uniref:Redox-active disulfide protein 2 n=1 Tax=Vecturithrix granuli TaxID=1499967 RepID=A0A081BWH3_VECG1|nr:redox-active disulfide protein 2 [Candidatus Vecturithrix granuli]
MITIEIFSGDCSLCEQLAENSRTALEELKLHGDVRVVADQDEIRERGITATPALVINDEVECLGRIPEPVEIMAWLQEIV